MKKLLFTMFGLMQAVMVMAAAPALSGSGNGDQVNNQPQMRKAVKPWLMVAVDGEGIYSPLGLGGPKGKWQSEPETPLHHKDGKPKGQFTSETYSGAQNRDGKPKGAYSSESYSQAHSRDGKPKGAYSSESYSQAHNRDGKPKGKLDAQQFSTDHK